jgi:CheY-like chemotaxis protein/anti-sigma regulatory factor (Ser/Thr protein kinase)
VAANAPILVADDNQVDRLILAKIIRDQGYDVVEAKDGEDAVAQYKTHQPQAILLDALMPKMDGFEVARIVKADIGEAFTPIIFLTALTEAEELARCIDAGGDDFLSKPYNRVLLKAKLEALQRLKDLQLTTLQQRDSITRNNQRLIQEQEAAKGIFDRIVHRQYLDIPFIRYLMSPIALFNGDVVLAAPTPRGTYNLLLGDFTGHGLTASVGAMPLAEAFYALTNRGLSIANIAQECNRRLNRVLPGGYFCCATLFEINFKNGTLECWSGGLPSAWLLPPMGQGADAPGIGPDVREMPSRHLPLGILTPDRFNADTEHWSLVPGERLVLCTDGVLEAESPAGEQFGERRLLALLSGERARETDTITALKEALAGHFGCNDGDDDITAVELTVISGDDYSLVPTNLDLEYENSPSEWRMSYEVADDGLKDFAPFPLLQRILLGTPALRPRMTDIGMVITEMYSNALEHGVLRLDSALKRDASGFARYYQARQAALEDVKGSVRFDLHCAERDGVVTLEIIATDSGPGFDTSAASPQNQHPSEQNYHGRGIRLLAETCSLVEHLDGGRSTRVQLVCPGNDPIH